MVAGNALVMRVASSEVARPNRLYELTHRAADMLVCIQGDISLDYQLFTHRIERRYNDRKII